MRRGEEDAVSTRLPSASRSRGVLAIPGFPFSSTACGRGEPVLDAVLAPTLLTAMLFSFCTICRQVRRQPHWSHPARSGSLAGAAMYGNEPCRACQRCIIPVTDPHRAAMPMLPTATTFALPPACAPAR
jgi:hypothetical protein